MHVNFKVRFHDPQTLANSRLICGVAWLFVGFACKIILKMHKKKQDEIKNGIKFINCTILFAIVWEACESTLMFSSSRMMFLWDAAFYLLFIQRILFEAFFLQL